MGLFASVWDMVQGIEPRVGDGAYVARVMGMLSRAGIKRRDAFLHSLGMAAQNFCAQIGADGLSWQALKERLGEEGWQRAVVFTNYMSKQLEADELKSTPWRLMTIALSPVRRATDASEDQIKWLDRLVEEAQRHCARVERIQKGHPVSARA
jgi:hypothetical protein